jgi:hypothetical protein
MMKRMHHDTITYRAAVAIFDNGIMTPQVLHIFVNLGDTANKRDRNLERGIETGWLTMQLDGTIQVTEIARRQIKEDREEATRVLVPETVPSRQVNLLNRPAYVPPKRTIRQDVPDWSKRPDGFSFYTVA